MEKFFKPEKITLFNHPEIKESLIQQTIADDPSILGLGELVLKDKERKQLRAGRLDLLMQDPESNRRYEIEVQLGTVNESHIIRTLEYWDIERKRYPQYDHCAVIIAEDITSRFLNIIGLFNGYIPLIAVQMNAYKYKDDIGLVFTKVLDELPLGLLDDDEEVQENTDRQYWLGRASSDTLKMADQILDIVNSFKDGYELKYNKFYIGLATNGQPNNFVLIRPKKKFTQLEIRLPKTEETDEFINQSELDDMGYNSRNRTYKIRLSKGEIKKNEEVLKELLVKSEENFNS